MLGDLPIFAAGQPDNPRPWSEIAGVAIVGIVLGLTLIIAAIRYMINKK
jgi:hypothetical protein